jgi:hypothetical protein
MDKKLWHKIFRENKLNEASEQKWVVYFMTPVAPEPEDAEGWISVGKTAKEADGNLKAYFKKKGFGKNKLRWYGGETKKYSGKEKPYTQIQ